MAAPLLLRLLFYQDPDYLRNQLVIKLEYMLSTLDD